MNLNADILLCFFQCSMMEADSRGRCWKVEQNGGWNGGRGWNRGRLYNGSGIYNDGDPPRVRENLLSTNPLNRFYQSTLASAGCLTTKQKSAYDKIRLVMVHIIFPCQVNQ